MIAKNLLDEYGAVLFEVEQGESIFRENDKPQFYYQIVAGEVKICNVNDQGKEFIQGIFTGSKSFAIAPLFGDFPYPANAVATKQSTILRLSKDSFFKLLEAHPKVHLELTAVISKLLRFKAIMASEIANNESKHRILRLFDYLKFDVYKLNEPFSYKVELTRNQIADLLGLRVETVIREIKNLEEQKEIKIKNRKVYR